jgi:hypothetical protein
MLHDNIAEFVQSVAETLTYTVNQAEKVSDSRVKRLTISARV